MCSFSQSFNVKCSLCRGSELSGAGKGGKGSPEKINLEVSAHAALDEGSCELRRRTQPARKAFRKEGFTKDTRPLQGAACKRESLQVGELSLQELYS